MNEYLENKEQLIKLAKRMKNSGANDVDIIQKILNFGYNKKQANEIIQSIKND